MKALALALCLAAADLEAVRDARRVGRFGEAWTLLEAAEVTPLEAERERVELYWAAGEPLLALGHVEAGLEHAPADLGLLHRGLSLSEWVGDPGRMEALLERLAGALAAGDLSAEDRRTWTGELAGFRERLGALEERAERREGAIGRARAVALGLLLATLVAGALFARGAPRSPAGTPGSR